MNMIGMRARIHSTGRLCEVTDIAASFAALQQSVEELSQSMQALLQSTQDMLQNIQALLEASRVAVQGPAGAEK